MADYRRIAREKAAKYGLDPNLFVRQIQAESGFVPGRVSPAGARGIAQIIPATARAWGVNPDDPVAALDAAARAMAGYVRRYGVEGALRAYNAGPGNIARSKGFAETNAYVARILGGQRSPGVRPAPRPDSGRLPALALGELPAPSQPSLSALIGPVEASPVPAPSFSTVGRYITQPVNPDPPPAQSALADRLAEIAAMIPPASLAAMAKSPASPQASPSRPSRPSRRGGLIEMFYNGPGGVNVDNGARQARGYVDGHVDHVHVSAGPRTVVRLAELAQRMGLRVGENPRYGGVSPVHVPGSYHYKGQAIDVSGDPSRMRDYNRRVAALYGF